MKNNQSLKDLLLDTSAYYGRKAEDARKKANFWLVMVFVSLALLMFLLLI